MDITISQESFEFIITQLESDDHDCSWQLARLPTHHKHEDNNIYRYWVDKQKTIRKALSELRG